MVSKASKENREKLAFRAYKIIGLWQLGALGVPPPPPPPPPPPRFV